MFFYLEEIAPLVVALFSPILDFDHIRKIPGKLLQLRFCVVQTVSLYMLMGCVGQKFVECKNIAGNLERQRRKQQGSYTQIYQLASTCRSNSHNTNTHTQECTSANVHVH